MTWRNVLLALALAGACINATAAPITISDGSGHEVDVSATHPLPTSGVSGGTTAVTVADCADTAMGCTTDTASANTVIGRLKAWIAFFPTNAALADATANPTLTGIGTYGLGYNGTTWDRLRSDNVGEQRVSLYGKQTTAGDTAIGVGSGGQVGMAVMSGGGLANAAVVTQIVNSDAIPNSYNELAVVSFPLVYNGLTFDRQRTPAIFKSQNAVAVATETTVWTPAAGKKFRLMRLVVASSVAGNLVFRDGTAGTIIAVVPTLAGAPIYLDFGNGILSAAANNLLTCTGPAASTLSGMIYGTEE